MTLLPALAAILFWGISFVATKAVVGEISPLALVTARAALGSALLFGLLVRGGTALPPRDAWPLLATMGFVGVAFHQGIQAYALTLTDAVTTGWLIGLTPVWSALLARWRLGERLTALKLGGLGLGFGGAALVVSRGETAAALLALPRTRGDLLILLSTLNWAVYTVMGRPILRRLGALPVTAATMAAGGAVLLAPFGATGAWRDYSRLSGQGWAALVFLGVFCSGLGYLFWYWSLARAEATHVAALLYVEPLVTMAAAKAWLGEPVGAATVAGGLLLLAGVACVQWAPRTAAAS
jgi:drug/metabolite transporter (DMT)-like permease